MTGPLTWPGTTLIDTDVAAAVPEFKAQDGPPLRVIGSVALRTSLLRLGLVDRLRLLVFPRLLGATGEEPTCVGVPDIDLHLDSLPRASSRRALVSSPRSANGRRVSPVWIGATGGMQARR